MSRFLCLLVWCMFTLSQATGQVSKTVATKQAPAFEPVYSQLSKLLDEKKFSAFAVQIKKALQQFPANTRLLDLKKKFVIEDYKASILNKPSLPEDKYFEKKPVTGSCQPGIVNAAGNQFVLDRINYVRRLAGIYDSCVLDPALNKKSQASALMMDANNMLDHSPKTSWKCYTKEGAVAAGSSNLSLGYSFADAIMGQVEDNGAGNGAVGHRRWILNPFNTVFGHGSTYNAMTLSVFGTADPLLVKNTRFADSQFVAWPAADYFPAELIPARWSFSLANADFSQAKLTVMINGKPARIKTEPVKTGYAINTLVWTIDGKLQPNQIYTISISQVKIVSGWGRTATSKIKSYTYKVTPVSSGNL
jgi:hypothetical protein